MKKYTEDKVDGKVVDETAICSSTSKYMPAHEEEVGVKLDMNVLWWSGSGAVFTHIIPCGIRPRQSRLRRRHNTTWWRGYHRPR